MALKHGGDVFAAARELQVDWRQLHDFSASINPLGMPPGVRQAIVRAMDRVVHYPEPDDLTLRDALARVWGTSRDRLMVGNGATDLLFQWCRWQPNGTLAAPVFTEFERAWPRAAWCDLSRPASWPTAGAVVLTRPANPTGVLPARQLVLDYAQQLRGNLLVDESFIDFTHEESLANEAYGNLFVLRSLTKFWALPGLRLGALVGDVEPLRAAAAPWSVNVLAAAAALAALADHEHGPRTRLAVARERTWLTAALGALPGFHVWPGAANFLYVPHARATEVVRFARQRGFLLRDCTGWKGIPAPALRIAVRLRRQNEALVEVLKEFVCVTG